MSPSPSPPPQNLVSIAATSSDLLTPLALPAPNAPLPHSLPAVPNPRRIPPPCWTDDETLALIHSYRDKYLSLNRGNLRAAHWDEVAASVSLRSRSTPGATPKTPVQCRHKIEKLRKRYRSERNRSLALDPTHPPFSPWIFFPHIHSMESPPPPPPPIDNYEDFTPRTNGALKFKITKAVRSRAANRAPDPAGEMVQALRALGDGYVRSEQVKMEMAREMERTRMEADLRRTKMTIDAQWRIVDAMVGEIAMGKRKRKNAKTAAAAAAAES